VSRTLIVTLRIEVEDPDECEALPEAWADPMLVSFSHGRVCGLVLQDPEDYVPLGYLQTLARVQATAEWEGATGE